MASAAPWSSVRRVCCWILAPSRQIRQISPRRARSLPRNVTASPVNIAAAGLLFVPTNEERGAQRIAQVARVGLLLHWAAPDPVALTTAQPASGPALASASAQQSFCVRPSSALDRPSLPPTAPAQRQIRPGQAQGFRKRLKCEDSFDYVGSSSSWIRSSSKWDLRKSIPNGVQLRRNFLEIFSGPEDTQRAKEVSGEWAEETTTHQGAPEAARHV